jgi:predicted NBD/HSP70 family sugar kinase
MSQKSNWGDKQKTKTLILQTLRMNGPIPRISLAKHTGLSRAAISSAISELLESGLVLEKEGLRSTGGRPPIALELPPFTHAVLGADYGNQEWTLGAFDLAGNVLSMKTFPVGTPDPEAAMLRLSDELPRFASGLKESIVPLLGLGMPGVVDTEKGIILSAADLGWSQVEIGSRMSLATGWPTVVLNRHRARGLAECRFGSGRELSHLIYAGVSTGISAGLFHNKQLLSGNVGGAGEMLGHITIEPDGPLCPCGNHGCLQLLAAEQAIEQEFRKLLRSGATSSLYTDPGTDPGLIHGEAICRAADQGDEAALLAVNKAATYLGIALATMINLFSPEGIILGGPIPRASRMYVDTAIKVAEQRAMPALFRTVFKTAAIHEIGGALGAANFALDRHLSLHLLVPSS